MSQPTLSLPTPLLTALTPSTHLHHHLTTHNTRPSHRAPDAFRPLNLTKPNLSHCAGSSLLTVGTTTVIVGITIETLLRSSIPDPPRARLTPPSNERERRKREQEDLAALSLLVPNVELGTGGVPSVLPGEPPGRIQQSLSARILRTLQRAELVRLDDLEIRRDGAHRPTQTAHAAEEEGDSSVVGYWTLYISVLPLSVSGMSSLFDAVWCAVYAALRAVKLPKAWWDADREAILCSPTAADARQLRLRGAPVATTFGVFAPGPGVCAIQPVNGAEQMDESDGGQTKKWILADPDGSEDGLCEEFLTLVVDQTNGTTRAITIEKNGGVSLGVEEVRRCLRLAEDRWKVWMETLSTR